MPNHQNNENHGLLLTILAGTVVGAIAAALINTKKGKELREDFYDAYTDAGKKFSDAAHHLGERSQAFSDRLLRRPSRNSNHLNLTIGAIAGSILGVSAIIFLTSNSAKGIREQACHTFECFADKAHNLEDKAHSIADNVEENVAEWVGKIEKVINAFNLNPSDHAKKNRNGNTFDKILDWAVVATQVFQSLKK